MYPKFRPVNNFAKPIFSSSKHSHLPLKCSPYCAAKLTSLTHNDLQEDGGKYEGLSLSKTPQSS